MQPPSSCYLKIDELTSNNKLKSPVQIIDADNTTVDLEKVMKIYDIDYQLFTEEQRHNAAAILSEFLNKINQYPINLFLYRYQKSKSKLNYKNNHLNLLMSKKDSIQAKNLPFLSLLFLK